MPQLPTPLDSGALRLAVGDETYVYQAFCLCGDLLYVGLTGNLFGRLTTHARVRAPWELKAAHIAWALYPTRAKAKRVESRLIRTLDPMHNVAGRSMAHRKPRWADLPELLPPPNLDERAQAAVRRLARGDRV